MKNSIFIMMAKIFLFVDWNRGVWVLQFRNEGGDLITEPTDYPAGMPALVVSNAIQRSRPGAKVMARLW
jgi:hypothetical protein